MYRHTFVGAPGNGRAGHSPTVREDIIEAVEISEGNLTRARHLLDISKPHMYVLLWRFDLWDAVDKIRAEAMRKFLAARARTRGEPNHERDERSLS